MPSLMKRVIQFVRSVMLADPAQLLFLCGCIFLFISFQLRWWPVEVTDSVRHIGPTTLYTSDDPVLQAVNSWIPFYWFCAIALSVCGAAGLVISVWPGTRPLLCVFLLAWLPCFLALAAICSRFLYLAKDPLFPLLDHAFLIRPHNALWAMAAVWQLGPGLHLSLLGLLLISIFLSRMAFGLTSLPVSLPEPRLQNSDDPEQWARILLLILFACTCGFLVRIIGGLPFLGLWFLFKHIGLIDTQGHLAGRASWILYLPGPLDLGIFASAAAWAVGKGRWDSLRQFLRVPRAKYLALAVLFPIVLRASFPLIMYSRQRIAWAAFQFGKIEPPSLESYFTIPAASVFANFMPAAFMEEVVWRGCLQPWFISRFGVYRGLFVVSMVWGVSHFQSDFSYRSSDATVLLGMVERSATCLALGFEFGWLTLRSGSIWPAAIAHGFYNVILQSGFIGYPMISRVLNIVLWAALAVLLFRFWPPQPLAGTSDEHLQLVPELPSSP
jgi:membrane protease YdiL (CAAX protease family)